MAPAVRFNSNQMDGSFNGAEVVARWREESQTFRNSKIEKGNPSVPSDRNLLMVKITQ